MYSGAGLPAARTPPSSPRASKFMYHPPPLPCPPKEPSLAPLSSFSNECKTDFPSVFPPPSTQTNDLNPNFSPLTYTVPGVSVSPSDYSCTPFSPFPLSPPPPPAPPGKSFCPGGFPSPPPPPPPPPLPPPKPSLALQGVSTSACPPPIAPAAVPPPPPPPPPGINPSLPGISGARKGSTIRKKPVTPGMQETFRASYSHKV